MPKNKTKYILLNDLRSKHSLLTKFDQFRSYYKIKKYIKKYKNCSLKNSSRPFCFCKELSTTSTIFTIGKLNVRSKLLI